MEKFLLLIIVVLLLAIVVTVNLMKTIFRFSHPYTAAVAQPVHAPVKGGGGIGGFLIVLLLAAMAFLTLPLIGSPNNGLSQKDTPETNIQPDRSQVENQKEPPDKIELYEPKVNRREQKPLRTHNRENDYLDTPAESWKVDRYNMHPDEALPIRFYAIQLEAFNLEENAKEAAEKQSIFHKSLFIIYMPDEVGPYKLVIAPFTSREAAQLFRQEYKTGGFIRLIDRD
jgi:hypothetical protein